MKHLDVCCQVTCIFINSIFPIIINSCIYHGIIFAISILGTFPEAQHDPVIQIANMVVVQGEQRPFIRNIFTLGSCAPIVGSHVIPYSDERKMLEVCICISGFIARLLEVDVCVMYIHK